MTLLLKEVKKNKFSLPELAIGIDLGTTNSLIAIYENDKSRILSTVKSTILFQNGKILIGKEYDNETDFTSNNLITSAKRLIGKNIDDVKDKHILNQIDKNNSDNIIKYKIDNNSSITPIEISAEILHKLKYDAEIILDKKITHAVITVPAYFDEAARSATKFAAEIAGIKVLRLINEPTAAALAYGLDNNIEGTYLVYDFGGGTFDISILKIIDNIVQVIGSIGDNNLGGDDIDDIITKFLIEKYVTENLNNISYNRFLNIARSLKEKLSYSAEASVKEIIDNDAFIFELNIEEFNNLIDPIIDKTIDMLKKLLIEKDLTSFDIDEVILVGGSTRIIQVKDKITKYLNKIPLFDIDPDQIVALGAAFQSAILAGKIDGLLIDVSSLSLGIEMGDGIVEKIIERNTALPCMVRKEFTTQADNQTGIKFHIVQGERVFAKDCRSLANFELKDITPLKAGMAKISVTFNLDSDGLLNIVAKDEHKNNMHEIYIKPSYGLSEAEIDNILVESMKNNKQDLEKRNLMESIFRAKNLIFLIEKDLENYSKYIDDMMINNIKKNISDLSDAINKSNLLKIDSIYNILKTSSNIIIQEKLDKYIETIKGKKIQEVKNIVKHYD